jgi:hypothetical protein
MSAESYGLMLDPEVPVLKESFLGSQCTPSWKTSGFWETVNAKEQDETRK